MLGERPWRPDLVLQYLTAFVLSVIAGILLMGILGAEWSPVPPNGISNGLS